jgi:hypothetical protein
VWHCLGLYKNELLIPALTSKKWQSTIKTHLLSTDCYVVLNTRHSGVILRVPSYQGLSVFSQEPNSSCFLWDCQILGPSAFLEGFWVSAPFCATHRVFLPRMLSTISLSWWELRFSVLGFICPECPACTRHLSMMSSHGVSILSTCDVSASVKGSRGKSMEF